MFSRLVGARAPFFATLKPRVDVLEPGRCVVRMRDRRGVRNHLGSVNAGALCTLCELAGGMAVDATLPAGLRWIPTGMTVRYLKKARGPLRAECRVDAAALTPGAVPVGVEILAADGDVVCAADISFLIRAGTRQ
jgi:uncharacterized protein (TIGR00369 family)